jgi:hypothetical protein
MNDVLGDQGLDSERLTEAFDQWWPHFEERMKGIPPFREEDKPPQRSDESKLDELLSIVRSMRQQPVVQQMADQADAWLLFKYRFTSRTNARRFQLHARALAGVQEASFCDGEAGLIVGVLISEQLATEILDGLVARLQEMSTGYEGLRVL